MGLSDEEGFDNETAQQMYYGTARFYRDYGTPEQLAKYTAGGPPPPEPSDGVIGKILWHEHHRATVEELTAILEQMRREGIVTDTGPRAYTGPIPPADIADLKAHMIEHPHEPMDTEQPANSGDMNERIILSNKVIGAISLDVIGPHLLRDERVITQLARRRGCVLTGV